MRWLFVLHVFLLALAGCSTPAGAVDSPRAPATYGELMERGEKLYVAKCARCHKFYDPAKYSDAKWHEWMDKMSKKARLKPDQRVILSEYLETFRTGAGTNTSAAPRP
jgi:hypothetical protein